jgi:hypothetical protein
VSPAIMLPATEPEIDELLAVDPATLAALD